MQLEAYLTQNPAKKSLIFDFDDTIAKLHIPWDKFENELRSMLIKEDEDLYVENEKLDYMELANVFIAELGDVMRAEFDCFQRSFETEHLESITPNPTLVSFIQDNYQKYDMYLWTNNNSYTIDNAMSVVEIFDCFIEVATRDMIELGKPSAQGFYALFGPVVSIEEKTTMVFIADDLNSERAAKEAGIDFFKTKAWPWLN